MKQLIRKTLLVLLGGVLCSSAWGEEVSGTTFLGGISSPYTIAPNETFSISFTSTAGGTDIWNAWVTILKPTDTTFNNDDTSTFYTLLRSDVYGWGNYYDATKISGSDPANITNATGTKVTLTIERNGAMVQTYLKAVTADDSKTYYQYYHNYIGDGTQDIALLLSVDNATLDIDESSAKTIATTKELNHLYVGHSDLSTPWWTAFSDYYKLAAGQQLKLKFVNHSSKVNNWNNWSVFVVTDANRFDTGYEEYIGLRADNWETKQNANTGISSNFNWDTFKDDMDGATVSLTVTRSGANVTVHCDITPSGGGSYFEEFTKECGDGTQNIRVFLALDGAYLDILPESIEIGATGWGTYVSDYNLDFSKAEEGLTAYKVTEKDGASIKTEELTGVVNAGTPMLLFKAATASTSYAVPVATAAGEAITGNCLKPGDGTAVNKETGYDRYVMVASSGKAVFKLINAKPATVNKNRAYLEFASSGEAHELLSLDGDDVTGIKNIKVGSEDNVYYNLNGQRVLYPTKGLYIVNGKKVIIK